MARDNRGEASAAGHLLEVGEFYLYRHGPSEGLSLLTPGPDLVGHGLDAGFDLGGCGQVALEGCLRAGGLARTIGDDGSLVLAAGNAEIPIGGFAEMLLQKAERFCFQIRARFDPEPLHPCCRDGSDAMKPGDRQRCDEILALSGVVTNWPFGLRWPDASLARNLCRKCPPRLSDLFREECAHESPWQ